MKYIVVIKPKLQPSNKKLIEEIKTIRQKVKIKDFYINKIYSFSGKITYNDVLHITKTLLVDSVVEDFLIYSKILANSKETLINIWYKPEVLDVESMYIQRAIKYIKFNRVVEIRSGKQLKFVPKIKTADVKFVVEKIFMNPLIQYYEIV